MIAACEAAGCDRQSIHLVLDRGLRSRMYEPGLNECLKRGPRHIDARESRGGDNFFTYTAALEERLGRRLEKRGVLHIADPRRSDPGFSEPEKINQHNREVDALVKGEMAKDYETAVKALRAHCQNLKK